MTTQNLALFKALGAKMGYLNQNQRTIAQNIANADTPNYQPQTVKELNFDGVLRSITNGPNKTVSMEATSAGHASSGLNGGVVKTRDQKMVYEITPDGNAVVIEEQLIKAQKNMMDYSLMTNLYQKNVSMMRTALGR